MYDINDQHKVIVYGMLYFNENIKDSKIIAEAIEMVSLDILSNSPFPISEHVLRYLGYYVSADRNEEWIRIA